MASLDIRLDGQKLMFHPQRVADWLNNRPVYPIYMEVSPSSGCNYRCAFCAYDFLDYRPEYIDAERVRLFLRDAAACGLKSVNFSGQGEPLLHPDIAGIIQSARADGLDCALTTNGTLLREELSAAIVPHLVWMRVSLNAGTPQTYARVHRHPAEGFYTVLENVRRAVAVKQRLSAAVTISMQYLLIEENFEEVRLLAEQAKDCGVDYLSVKPFSLHPRSENARSSNFQIGNLERIAGELQQLNDGRFTVHFRLAGFQKQRCQRPYRECLGLPFFAELTTGGDLYPCNNFIGDPQWSLGSMHEQSFRELWNSDRRRQVMNRLAQQGVSACRCSCRLDEINAYLWRVRHPQPHDNYI